MDRNPMDHRRRSCSLLVGLWLGCAVGQAQELAIGSPSFSALPLALPTGAAHTESAQYTARAVVGDVPGGVVAQSAHYALRGGLAFSEYGDGPHAPLVFGAEPSSLPSLGGGPLTIHGLGFGGQSILAASLGGVPVAGLGVQSDKLLAGTAGNGLSTFTGNPLGRTFVSVLGSNGVGVAPQAFTYFPALTLESPALAGANLELGLELGGFGFYVLALGTTIPGFGLPVPGLTGSLELVTNFLPLVEATPTFTGEAQYSVLVPPVLAGITVHFQALIVTDFVPLTGQFTNSLGVTFQ
jgi:hypothetical protein